MNNLYQTFGKQLYFNLHQFFSEKNEKFTVSECTKSLVDKLKIETAELNKVQKKQLRSRVLRMLNQIVQENKLKKINTSKGKNGQPLNFYLQIKIKK